MNKERVKQINGARSLPNEYREYLLWLRRTSRVHVKPPTLSIPIDEGESDDEDPYDIMTRTGVQPERAPLENYMVSTKLQFCHVKS
jgi:hypothetical protein